MRIKHLKKYKELKKVFFEVDHRNGKSEKSYSLCPKEKPIKVERYYERNCVHCSFSTRNFRQFFLHYRDVHSMAFSFQCIICKSIFSTIQVLQTHLKRKH